MTLIEIRDGSGTVVGRCDAKCYNAEQPHCDCVCGGMNHGAGKQKALENTKEYVKEMIKEYVGKKGLKKYEALIGEEVVQDKLF